jgi:hypothetical protein
MMLHVTWWGQAWICRRNFSETRLFRRRIMATQIPGSILYFFCKERVVRNFEKYAAAENKYLKCVRQCHGKNMNLSEHG